MDALSRTGGWTDDERTGRGAKSDIALISYHITGIELKLD